MLRRLVACFFFPMTKMSGFLYERHWGGPAMTSLKVLGVLSVPNVLNELKMLYLLNVLNMSKDASLTCLTLLQRKPLIFDS